MIYFRKRGKERQSRCDIKEVDGEGIVDKERKEEDKERKDDVEKERKDDVDKEREEDENFLTIVTSPYGVVQNRIYNNPYEMSLAIDEAIPDYVYTSLIGFFIYFYIDYTLIILYQSLTFFLLFLLSLYIYYCHITDSKLSI